MRTTTTALVVSVLVLTGCDLTRFTASSTAALFHRAAPALDAHWDYELAGRGLPGTILQSEGVLRVVPDDAPLTLDACRAYGSYAFGWVEDSAERLRREGRAEEAAAQQARAIELYQRGVELGHRYLQLRSGGEFEPARARSIESYRAWLRSFDRREDAPGLFWSGYVWGLSINATHPNDHHRDRAFAIALVARSVELDPSYYGASGLALLAYVATQRPGADLDEARRRWDRALEVSGRQNHLIHVTMARTYAVRRGDRALFISLLREVIDAEEGDPSMRLSNRIARRRAIRYLGEVDRWISPRARGSST